SNPASAFFERNRLRRRLAIRAVAAPQGIHRALPRQVRTRRQLLRPRRHGAQVVPRCEYGNVTGSFRRRQMTCLQKQKEADVPRLSPSALNTAAGLQICPIPPSTLSSTPVIYEASCEARNATAPATYSGCPNLFIGTFVRTSFA